MKVEEQEEREVRPTKFRPLFGVCSRGTRTFITTRHFLPLIPIRRSRSSHFGYLSRFRGTDEEGTSGEEEGGEEDERGVQGIRGFDFAFHDPHLRSCMTSGSLTRTRQLGRNQGWNEVEDRLPIVQG